MGTILRALQVLPKEAVGPTMAIQPPPPAPLAAQVALDPFGTKVKGKDQSRMPTGFSYPVYPTSQEVGKVVDKSGNWR